MGDNQAWTVIEKQVITFYDLGVMNSLGLDVLCGAFSGRDVDPGGSRNLKTKDGKSFEQVCVELVKPDFVPNETEDDWWSWADEFSEISSRRWNWR